MKPRVAKNVNCSSVTTFGKIEVVIWIPLDEISKHKLFPEFLKANLECLAKSKRVIHIVTNKKMLIKKNQHFFKIEKKNL